MLKNKNFKSQSSVLGFGGMKGYLKTMLESPIIFFLNVITFGTFYALCKYTSFDIT